MQKTLYKQQRVQNCDFESVVLCGSSAVGGRFGLGRRTFGSCDRERHGVLGNMRRVKQHTGEDLLQQRQQFAAAIVVRGSERVCGDAAVVRVGVGQLKAHGRDWFQKTRHNTRKNLFSRIVSSV